MFAANAGALRGRPSLQTNVAATARGASADTLRRSGDRPGLGAAVQAGRETAWRAGAKGEGASAAPASETPAAPVPAWANDLRTAQRRRAAGQEGAQQSGARAGEQLVGRALDIAPTIRVRPGWPLSVIVHRDLVLQP